MPQHDLESNSPSNPSTGYNTQAYLKAGLIFVTTTATFLLVKTTGFLPSWLWSKQGNQPNHQAALVTTDHEIALAENKANIVMQASALNSVPSLSDEHVNFEELTFAASVNTQQEAIVELDTDEGLKIPSIQRTLLSPIPLSTQFPANIALSSLNGHNGFTLNGVEAGDYGAYVSNAGDVNVDGITDLIIGAPYASPEGRTEAGSSYVVFGSSSIGSAGTIELSNLNGANGFILNGVVAGDFSGESVSSAGDVNVDGIDDLIIGASHASPGGRTAAGSSYVVFGGRNVGSSGTLELSNLNGANGFVINGVTAEDISGAFVSRAGDVNADGIDDLIIGAWGASSGGRANTGSSYVVFGGSGVGSSGTFELSSLNGVNGFKINGINTYDGDGPVSNVGDVNADGIDDLIIGAGNANPGSRSHAGSSYVIFGSNSIGGTGTLALSTLNGSNGFRLNGVNAEEFSGTSVSGAGDVNADGIADFIIGAPGDGDDTSVVGSSYVVFGRSGIGGSGTFELSSLNGANGFKLSGVAGGDYCGESVSNVGDINADGVADFMIGAPYTVATAAYAGASYVVFGGSGIGSSGVFALSSLNGVNGFVMNGIAYGDFSGWSVSSAGDVNKDGISDLIIGAHQTSYVVFGDISPQLITNRLAIRQNQTLQLTSANLNATDLHYPTDNLLFEVSNLTHGQFELTSAKGMPITSFLQQQLRSGQVQFVHDGGEIAPAYAISVHNAGFALAPDQLATITFTNIPVLENNQLTLNEGQTVVLSTTNLNIIDPQKTPSQLTLTISNVQHGQFALVSDPKVAITTFTQQQVNAGQIQFIHDGSQVAPSYSVSASDGVLSTASLAGQIYFTPANPLIVNNSLTLKEGQTVILSLSDLSASDAFAVPDSQLTFMVSNVQHGQFELVSNPNVAISSFTQEQIKGGQIQFVQDSNPLAPSYDISVNDGMVTSASVAGQIVFTPANPLVVNNHLTINEGQTVILSSSDLSASDAFSSPPSQLAFTLSNVQHGQFELVSNPGVAIVSFTQEQINAGQIQFVQDASQVAPSYDVSVSDGVISSSAVAGQIYFTPANPQVINNNLTLNEGQIIILSPNDLSATDAFTVPASQLTFTVSDVQQGQFEGVNNPGVAITRFTAEQVNNKEVQFVHDGDQLAPSYSVSVSDGMVSSRSTTATIAYTPVSILNQLVITAGQTVVLSPANLGVSGVNANPLQVTFIVSNVKHGRFELVGTPNVAITEFTLAQINGGQIQFVQDGSATAPSYSVAVSAKDKSFSTLPRNAKITFTPPIIASSPDTRTTVRNGIIGGIASGVVGLAFLGAKIYITRKAEQRFKEATLAEEKGVGKQQLDFQKNVLRPIAERVFNRVQLAGCLGYLSEDTSKEAVSAISVLIHELQQQGLDIKNLDKLDSVKQDVLLNEIAKQVKRELVPDTGFCSSNTFSRFFCPEVTPQQIEDKAGDIAKKVKESLNRRNPFIEERKEVEMQGATHDGYVPLLS